MIKSLALILISALFLQSGSSTKLNLEEIDNFINTFFNKNFANLDRRVYEDPKANKNSKMNDYYTKKNENDQGSEVHAVSTTLEFVNSSIKLAFSMTKKPYVEKTMETFHSEEWNAQIPALKFFVSKLMIIETEDRNNTSIYFNTINDVISKVIAKTKVHNDIKPTYTVTKESSKLELHNNESLIAFVNVEVNKKLDSKSKEYHYLNVRLKPSKMDAVLKPFEISMIARDNSNFDHVINEIIAALDLDNYFNNNQDNFNIIKKFFESDLKLPFIEKKTLDKGETNYTKEFEVSFEENIFHGFVKYIKPSDSTDIGSYSISLTYNGDLIDIPLYHRMKKNDLRKMLLDLNLKDKLKSVKDIIFDIFKAKYEAHYSKKISDTKFNDTSSRIYGSHTRSAKATSQNTADITYKESKNKVQLHINIYAGLNIQFDYEFIKSKFKVNIIRDIIEMLMKSSSAKLINEEVL